MKGLNKGLSVVLPGLALGIAVVLIAPGTTTLASFTVNGSLLQTSQRDVRLFDNLLDAASNNNVTPDVEFPGYLGAELATWKAVVEWGSELHGTGIGDPVGGNLLGNGAANFDAAWMGNAAGVGNTNNNIISGTTGCQSGVVAFAEGPYSDGWRIRLCDDQWNFADGPGGIGFGAFDIQGILAHEYGHALGLGHSCNNAATMAPSSSPGSTALRSINFDDGNGIRSIYGNKSATKPIICQTSVNGGVLTITGDNFHATNNDVWFTNSATSATGGDPRVIVGPVASTSNKFISVTIPAGAGPGDVLVKVQGGANGSGLSNAFPTDLVGLFANGANCPIQIDLISPSTVPALSPGLDQNVTITGSGFLLAIEVSLNGGTQIISTSDWTIVSDTTITVNMPQFNFLTTTNLTVASAGASDFGNITVAANTTPALEMGNGEDFNVTTNFGSLHVTMAGTPGTLHRIYYSGSALPSCHALAKWLMGNQFSEFFNSTVEATIPAKGWIDFNFPVSFTGPAVDFYTQSIDLTTAPAPMFGISNLQIFTLTE